MLCHFLSHYTINSLTARAGNGHSSKEKKRERDREKGRNAVIKTRKKRGNETKTKKIDSRIKKRMRKVMELGEGGNCVQLISKTG